MGLAFKNCPDLRNARVVDLIAELQDFGVNVDVFDPWVDVAEANGSITPIAKPEKGAYDGIVLAVAHQEFVDMCLSEIRKLGRGYAL